MSAASNSHAQDSSTKQLCTFFVDRLYFGIDVRSVQEVIRYQPMTPVPLASPVISGLINLRGQIVTTIDLRRLLGLPGRPAGTLPMNVVVRSSESAVSLLVDEIGDVVHVGDERFERAPETIGREAKALIRGIYKLNERLLMLLDTDMATRGAALDHVAEGSDHGKWADGQTGGKAGDAQR